MSAITKFRVLLRYLSFAFIAVSLAVIQPMQAVAYASGSNTISGHISDRAGYPILSAQYSFVSETDGNRVVFSTDDNGDYSIGVTPGKYYLTYAPNYDPDRFAIAALSTVGFIDATGGNVTQDFQYDTIRLDVRFVDQNNIPISNARASINAVGGETTFPVGRPDIVYTSYGTYPSEGFTDNDGVMGRTVLRGFRYDVCATDPVTQVKYCGRFTSINQDVNTVTISVGSPAAPTDLNAQSPVQSAPSLSWSPVTNARSFSVYRDNLEISSTTGTSFVDSNATEGMHSYYVIASSCCNISSSPSNTVSVLYDKTAPVTSSPTLSTSLVLFSANMTMNANATDALSGVAGGEFYIDTDPGQGQGTPMTYSNGKITASKTITGVGLGQHKVYMRTLDKAGNWSAPVYAQFSYIGF